jgi:hypothetical protein
VSGRDPSHKKARLRLAIVLGVAALISAVALGVSLAQPESSATRAGNCPKVGSSGKGPRPTLIVGANSVWNRLCDLRALTSAGVRWERFEIDWSAVEPKPGRWTWGYVDRQFAETARAGVTILPVLMGPPRWAERTDVTIPSNPNRFAAFVAQVVRRYGTQGTFWRSHRSLPNRGVRWFELWNEPYLPQFSAGGPRPDLYARLVKAATIAGRQANPSAHFLLQADTLGFEPGGHTFDWVGAMYSAVPDLNQFFDGVAAHPYAGVSGPDYYTPDTQDRGQFRRIQELHDNFVSRGAGDKPFWITEVGWSTCPANRETCVTPAKQAAYTQRVFQIVKTEYRPWVQAVFLYNYRDSFRTEASNKEYFFGILHHDGTPKPVWNVIRRVNSAG